MRPRRAAAGGLWRGAQNVVSRYQHESLLKYMSATRSEKSKPSTTPAVVTGSVVHVRGSTYAASVPFDVSAAWM